MKAWQRACVCASLCTAGVMLNRVGFAEGLWRHHDARELDEGEKQKLRELISEASVAYSKSEWEVARQAYLLAWQLSPHPLIAANLGDVEVRLDRCTEAAEHLRYFLDNVPPGTPAEKQSNATERFAACRPRVAAIAVSANVAGSRLTIDHREAGETPLTSPVFVTPGSHVLQLEHQGYRVASRAIDAAPGADINLQFELEEDTPSPKPLPMAQPVVRSVPPASLSGQASTRTWLLAGGIGATVVALGIGIGYRLRADSLHDDGESALQRLGAGNCNKPTGAAEGICAQLSSTWASYDTAANVSTGALITAGVFGVATTFTYVLWPSKRPHVPGSAVRFSVAPLGRAPGVGLVGRF